MWVNYDYFYHLKDMCNVHYKRFGSFLEIHFAGVSYISHLVEKYIENKSSVARFWGVRTELTGICFIKLRQAIQLLNANKKSLH